MAKSDVAVLDFGSSKLTLLVGRPSVNNNFIITASSDIDYGGFMDGEFLESDELGNVIRQAVEDINNTFKKSISKLYVGVPSEFCKIENRVLTKNFSGKVLLDNKKIDSLFEDADDKVISDSHSVINVSPIYYTLDESNITNNPLGCYCRTISCEACYVMADDYFLSIVGESLDSLNIKNVEYVCSALAEGEYLFSEEIKNHGLLFVDCGYLTTTVAYFKGEGFKELNSFSLGGAQITANLSEGLKLPFSVAEQVKQNLLLSVKATGLDYYEAYKGNKLEKIQAIPANEIALTTIDEIAKNIDNIINSYDNLPADYETLYLTGGGISYLKGIKYYLSKALGRRIEIVSPAPLKFNQPDLSSAISLLDTAIKMN